MVGLRREIGWAYKLHVGMLLALGAVKSGYACDSGLMIGGVGWSLKRKVWGEGVGGGSANAASVSHLRRLSFLWNYSQLLRARLTSAAPTALDEREVKRAGPSRMRSL
jgi:hypothetical protein